MLKKCLNVADYNELEMLVESMKRNVPLLADNKYKLIWIKYVDYAEEILLTE